MQSWWWRRREVMVWRESVEWEGKEELAFGASRQNWISIVRNGGSGSLSCSGESNKTKKGDEFQPIIARRLSGLDLGSQTNKFPMSKFHAIFYLHVGKIQRVFLSLSSSTMKPHHLLFRSRFDGLLKP